MNSNDILLKEGTNQREIFSISKFTKANSIIIRYTSKIVPSRETISHRCTLIHSHPPFHTTLFRLLQRESIEHRLELSYIISSYNFALKGTRTRPLTARANLYPRPLSRFVSRVLLLPHYLPLPFALFRGEEETKGGSRIYSIYFHRFIDSRRFSLFRFPPPLVSGERKSGPSFFLTSGILRADTIERAAAHGRGRWSRETIVVRPDGLCRFHLRLSFDRPTEMRQ